MKGSGDDLRAWCEFKRRPRPDPAKLGAYLGRLACGDDTDKAYLAQGLLRRTIDAPIAAMSEARPNAFLEALKGCPAFGLIPADLKSRLERAAQQDRENAAKPKGKPENVVEPIPPKVSEICAQFDEKPAGSPTTGSTKPPP